MGFLRGEDDLALASRKWLPGSPLFLPLRKVDTLCETKMPQLSEIRCSRQATVAAISGCFDLLANMYLDEGAILRAPEWGWPEMTPERLRGLGKTDEVILLLRHVPYLRSSVDDSAKSEADAGPSGVHFWNWIKEIQ